MKKVLFSIFATLLTIARGYCENTSYVDTNLSSSDSMNAVVSCRAIYEGFKINKCFYGIQANVKDEIARLIGEQMSMGRNITLNTFLSICIMQYDAEIINSQKDIPGYAENCIGCTMDIAKKHNELVRQHEQEQINNIDVFTSEEEYNRVLKAKGICTYNVDKRDFFPNIRSRSACEKNCRNFAITNACMLEGTYFSDGTCYCTEENISLRGWGTFKSYRVLPTWEDYKNLYKIK